MVGHGYVDALTNWTPSAGLTARLEAGYHPLAPVSLYAAAQWNSITGSLAEGGVRWVF